MARLRRRARRNPLKPIGALLINPSRKRRKHRNPPDTNAYKSAGYGTRVAAAHAGAVKPQRAYRRREMGTKPKGARIDAFNYHTAPQRLVMPRAAWLKMLRAGKKKVSKGKSTAKRNPMYLRANPRRRMHARRNPLYLRTNPRRRMRRNARRNPLFMRTNPLFLKTNPRKRRKSRKSRRNGFSLFKRNPAGGMLAKIPVIGPTLAAASTFLMPGAFGAVAVEPVMMVATFAAPYLPAAMPFSLTIAAAGVALAAVIKKFGPFSDATNTSLAIAAASGSGAIAYWTWRNGDDAPVKEKIGALIIAGYGSPLAGAIMGDANLGSLISAASYGSYGDYGYSQSAAATPVPTMGWGAVGSVGAL